MTLKNMLILLGSIALVTVLAFTILTVFIFPPDRTPEARCTKRFGKDWNKGEVMGVVLKCINKKTKEIIYL